jgi:galactonate dehydratase
LNRVIEEVADEDPQGRRPALRRGWRVNSFLKVTTDEGIVGWSEYMEGYGAQELTGVILKLAERFLIGQDPRPVERYPLRR